MEVHPGDIRKNMIGAFIGGLVLMACLAAMLSNPVPFANRDGSPGFGWSWDFEYRRAIREPDLTAGSPANQPIVSSDQFILAIGEPVSIAGLTVTYKGLARSGRFRIDAAIPALDAHYAYPYEFSESEARHGFSLVDQRFALISIGPSVLRLRHLPR